MILHKLDSLFGDVSTHGMLMQEFFNSYQKPGESVTGCRLENLLQLAEESGQLARGAKNDLLRHKFWTSLSSDRLKSQTRHKYDSISNYDALLREIRIVEKEIAMSPDSELSSKKPSHQPVVTEDQLKELEKRVDLKLDSLEKKLDSKLDEKFNVILQKLDQGAPLESRPRPDNTTYNNNNNNNNRSYNNNRNYNNNRSTFRDNSRGRGSGRPHYSSSRKPDQNPLNG